MRRLILLTALLIPSCAAFAQMAPQYDPNLNLGKPGQDQDFLEAAMKQSNAEIEWSKIAAQKSANPDVKALANDIVSDEMPVAARLVAEAKSFKLKVPTALGGKEKKTSDKLNGLSGADFDKEYLSDLIKLQHEDVNNMLDESKESRTPALQSFASTTVDQITRRNDKAKAVQAKVGK
jgi:putative membrane protein